MGLMKCGRYKKWNTIVNCKIVTDYCSQKNVKATQFLWPYIDEVKISAEILNELKDVRGVEISCYQLYRWLA